MSKKNLALARAYNEFISLYENPDSFPVSFTYAGMRHSGFSDFPLKEKNFTDTNDGKKFALVFSLDENLICKAIGKYCAGFGQYEYTIYFENTGDKPSAVLSDIYCLDRSFDGANGVLRGNLGDHANQYRAYCTELDKESVHFLSTTGRATHIVFPYFDLVHGDGGSLIALGWAGTWESDFVSNGDSVSVKAKSCVNFEASILPDECVRSALVVILPYSGRDEFNATNLWREWFMKYNLPKANKNGDKIEPFTTLCWAGDTGLPNSDGSISERHFTWRRTFDKMVKEKIYPDFRWFDAGWYSDPAKNTVESDWWGTVGSWELDPEKWPNGSFRESVDACHSVGVRTFVWFEPERVTHVDDLVKNYGYNPEWGINIDPHLSNPVITNNIGDDECLMWTFERIRKMLEENDVDLYREDNNSDPARAWVILDNREEARHSLPRQGISENKLICGHYKLWDMILEFLGNRGKCTFLDSCASGGGRNDIESLRRSIPFLRSDSDRTTSSLRLSMSASFNKWIPICGASTKETREQLEGSKNPIESAYVNRASFLPIMNIGVPLYMAKELNYEGFHKNVDEWKDISHLLTKDFYVLTPWHHESERSSWTVFAYDDPEIGESIILAFRMEDCPDESYTFALPFAESSKEYVLTNVDTAESEALSGESLAKAYTVSVGEAKKSVFIKIKRK